MITEKIMEQYAFGYENSEKEIYEIIV